MNEKEILPPVFLIEGWDVAVFSSAEDAAKFLEPDIVAKGRDLAFDTRGRLLNVRAQGDSVRITLAETNPSKIGVFEDRLRHYLEAVGDLDADDQNCDLSCLIDLARKHTVPDARSGFPLRNAVKKWLLRKEQDPQKRKSKRS